MSSGEQRRRSTVSQGKRRASSRRGRARGRYHYELKDKPLVFSVVNEFEKDGVLQLEQHTDTDKKKKPLLPEAAHQRFVQDGVGRDVLNSESPFDKSVILQNDHRYHGMKRLLAQEDRNQRLYFKTLGLTNKLQPSHVPMTVLRNKLLAEKLMEIEHLELDVNERRRQKDQYRRDGSMISPRKMYGREQFFYYVTPHAITKEMESLQSMSKVDRVNDLIKQVFDDEYGEPLVLEEKMRNSVEKEHAEKKVQHSNEHQLAYDVLQRKSMRTDVNTDAAESVFSLKTNDTISVSRDKDLQNVLVSRHHIRGGLRRELKRIDQSDDQTWNKELSLSDSISLDMQAHIAKVFGSGEDEKKHQLLEKEYFEREMSDFRGRMKSILEGDTSEVEKYRDTLKQYERIKHHEMTRPWEDYL